ncbi:MAG TPA: selenide, water dikinase SelD [Candidatus Acidoferrales bacterium]|nr:selenide, water dikinase SelD [Candidatus Acidoferrales bacterium]
MSPGLLDSVLRRLPRPNDPNLLVGFDTSDDAGVYRLTSELALVQTVDFLTPIADDPFTFGQIAAANSLSDVYAMGGRPVSALSIVGFPADGDGDVLEQILLGGLSKMDEARCTIVGGHSVRDDDLKFGYAVTGVINPKNIWRNVGAQSGDALILTKPIGTGVIATALKADKAPAGSVEAAVASMARLNRDAAAVLCEIEASAVNGTPIQTPIHAVTDVTGFGLLGHAREMAAGSDVSLHIDHAKVPFLAGAREAARDGFLAGGLKSNREFVGSCVGFAANIGDDFRALLFDPQTSGGLLISIAQEHAAPLCVGLHRRQIPAVQIGEVISKRSPLIEIT